MTVGGVEGNPIFVVATEEGIWTTTSDDYISGVPLRILIDRLVPGESVYLVHLDSRRADGKIKVTNLLPARPLQ